jgi:phosphatidate cytidylyltransferase
MSDDAWRGSGKRGEDDEFGPPLFGDPTDQPPRPALSFDDNTGPLPHWTAPPSGETAATEGGDDVWDTFSSASPVWSDDEDPDPSSGYENVAPSVRSGQMAAQPYYEGDPSGSIPTARPGPGRITIGTDPTDEQLGRPGARNRNRAREEQARAAAARQRQNTGGVRTTTGPVRKTGGIGGRDMPTAIVVGAILAAVFIAAIKWRPQAVLVIVVIVIGLAAVEFFEKVSEKGYQPSNVVGIVACISAPLAGYFYGDAAVPMVVMFGFVAGSLTFITAPSLNSSPMPNMAITSLGVTWIGLAGAYGGLILRLETFAPHLPHLGTDTLLLLAIGVVVNDIGALVIGSAAGKTPLRGWISPNKSVEGFIGGAFFTIVAMVIVGITKKSDNWSSPNLIFLGVVIALVAPLGDLTESMFKRNLDIKDFGSIVKGHGGILDRFDGFLFTLPAVYYLTLVLEPWQAAFGK